MVSIYALKDPRTGEIRYVGKTSNPDKRLAKHVWEAQSGMRNHRANWIKDLLMCNQSPEMEILDEVPEDFWQQWEIAWIEFFREQGFDLVNSTRGGEGWSAGQKRSQETRNRLSIAMSRKRKPLTPGHRKKISNTMTLVKKGKTHSTRTKMKISELLVGNQNARKYPQA
jgi:hypothetical protein